MVIQTWIYFKVEAGPALLALAYAVRIAEEHHPINDNDDDLINGIYFSMILYDKHKFFAF